MFRLKSLYYLKTRTIKIYNKIYASICPFMQKINRIVAAKI